MKIKTYSYKRQKRQDLRRMDKNKCTLNRQQVHGNTNANNPYGHMKYLEMN